MDDVQEPAPRPAVRLIFEYRGDDVRLVSQQPVDVAVPGFDLAQVPHPGHYVETRDEASTALGRVPVREAFATSAEVFPEDHGEPITRVEVEPQGAFTVIVPAGAGATQVALVEIAAPEPGAAPPTAARATTPAGEPVVRDVATFPLDVGGQP